jgi:hypothetical protein
MILLGRAQVVHCRDGEETDVRDARRSASDVSGNTYALGEDSNYLVYGWPSSSSLLSSTQCRNGEGVGAEEVDVVMGEARYVQFRHIDPLSSPDRPLLSLHVGGRVALRTDTANAIGLPRPDATIELSILLGNDYTGLFLIRKEDARRQQKYWESLRWHHNNDNDDDDDDDDDGDDDGRLPPEDELGWHDIRGIANYTAMRCADGWRPTLDNLEMRSAI